jgi:heptose I phosphotransferase
VTRFDVWDDVWRERLNEAGVKDPAVLLDSERLDQIGAGGWTRLSKPGLGGRERWRWSIGDGTGDAGVVYLKRYRYSTLKTQFDRMFRQTPRHSVAWWEFELARRLEHMRIPAAEAVGAAERMHGLFEDRSIVLLKGLNGDAFDRWWSAAGDRRRTWSSGGRRHDLTRRLARFVAAFHQTGYRHRDLYLCHVFIDFDDAGVPGFKLIDLARVFRPRWRKMRWLIKDLSQLETSARQIGLNRTDRLRFLISYLGLQKSSGRVRRLARQVARKSDRILARIERKNG